MSVQTLGFVARRLLAEPIALVFGIRDDPADVLTGLPELAVAGLADGDARDLLESVMLGGIDPRVKDRIVAETRGNPLALLEVPRNVPATELAGGFWVSGTRPSAGQIEDGFLRRIQALPTPTQTLLLVAAAEPVGDAALFLRAAANLGVPVDALAPAEAAGVIEFGPRMRFHHPLVRSAAYRAADLADRRAIHRALADATDAERDPDRRAWHAANAVAGPDDAVATELEASAWRARSRGGIAAAAALLERAAVLTADPAARGSRAIAAAQTKRDAAAPEAAYELLALAEAGPLSDLQRAQVARLRAQMQFARSRGGGPGTPPLSEAATQLLDAAKRLESLDGELARETYVEAIAAAMYAGRLGEPGLLTDAAEAARVAVARVPELQRRIDLLLSGIANRIARGMSVGSDTLRTPLELVCAQTRGNDSGVLRWVSMAFPIIQESAAHELWDHAITRQLASDIVRHARAAGALALLPAALTYLAGAHLLEGEFNLAATLLDEADAISAATSYKPVTYHRLHLAAWRGSSDDALGLIDAANADATAKGEGRLLGLTGYARALLYNGLGRYQEAFAAAQKACEYEDLGFHGWCLLELIEAAAHTGQREHAAAAIQQLAATAGASGTDWGLGTLASAKALLADGDDAEALFTEAIDHLERSPIAVQLARTRLRYGEWLRRNNRRADARRQLGAAHETFIRMGAQAFADRARRELTAAGEKVRKQPVASGDELTAQEAQIAALARDGLTNQEIGAQLFISTHTVEWHLRKVFVKLGITSRRQLRTISWAS
ncbi:helix-turn-helix transcriptional regulator [Mycolicibacterium celeriflavum]|uniref:Transcriptional regulator n=1 Tax=Mycolicibacterium celeriflavum TaxID=1249101 RepID=A0A1X0BTC4_MYCCF|nr:helix-turn-helix transcriptional regulator [Mycolicibacterium celeriflavum]MCV7239159.1 LuxR family transcriptional regulator [Mycolicibacterium celeriflavum]ORA46882.1 LuxR family transcriptional regulator [Mycolicibacterium celeriflavum]BBY44461.1 transcriptional regulator [Mycolicibacterium celeriflavum]